MKPSIPVLVLAASIAVPAQSQSGTTLGDLDEVVITVTPLRGTLFETAQPVSVLAGEALVTRRKSSLGETLADQPGVSASAFGPIASRPVIRGQGGFRVQTLQDGADTLDVAALSDDHAVGLESMLADRIEVLRGPAALLFGSTAAAGVVNVITPRLSMSRYESPFAGAVEMRGDSAANERGVAARVGGHAGDRLQFFGDLHHFQADDLRIPDGRLENSDGETRGGSAGLSWIGEQLSFAVSLSDLRMNYGLPGHEHHHEDDDHEEGLEGEEHEDELEDVRLGLDQRRVDFSGEWRLDGSVDALRFRAARNDYEHAEFEGDGVGTVYAQDGKEVRVSAEQDRRWSIGLQWRELDFDAEGEEAFLPASRTRHRSAYGFGETSVGRVTFEGGLRVEKQDIDLEGGGYDNDALSGSVGVRWRPSDPWAVTLQLTSTARHPTATELYALGPHLAVQRFEVGDEALGIERNASVDLGIQHRTESGWTVQVSAFVSDYDQFIAAMPEGSIEDDLPVFRFVGVDARFEGVEFDWRHEALLEVAAAKVGFRVFGDYVRARDSAGDPLPQIPPRRLGLELGYTSGPLRLVVETIHHDAQDELAKGETRTAGFTAVNTAVTYNLRTGDTDMLWFVRGVNLLDEEMRRHASPLKDVAPLAARHLAVGLQLKF
ncbi:MAG: TonB-dependent receptor [Gammaproteobacteria bacterium]|nr:TonB-dependent receptor [Gammaproteobacteria bacterium]